MLRPTRLTTAALAAVVLAAGGGAVAAAQSGSAPTAAQDFSLKVPKLKSTYVDTGRKGFTTGDFAVDSGSLVDLATGANRGTIIDTCLLAKVGSHDGYLCHGGLVLATGRIAVALSGVREEKVSTFAITGGTRAFATARGTVVTTPLSSRDGGPSRVDVHIAG